jgi:uncharacterized protein with HEPN domain
MKGPLTDKIRVQHILDAMAEIERYIAGITYTDFLNNSEKRFATIKQIEIIGEACNAITDDVKKANPSIQWKPIIGFRNISVHEYFGVNFQIVWEIALHDIPVLKAQMVILLTSL